VHKPSLKNLGLGLAAVICIARSSPAQIRSSVYVTGMSLPVEFVQDPTDSSVQYVVEQSGRVRIIRSGHLESAPFLDLSASIRCCGEQGLLGMAFAPDYSTSARVFFYFNEPTNGNIVVARFTVAGGVVTPGSRFDLKWSTGDRFIDHSLAGNHNGGHLEFGPDGFLYIGVGDGGGGGDTFNNGQNMSSLLGKMLRIDVNVAASDPAGFRIPAGNPFATSSRPEIWDVGLRNPWKWSFDTPSRGGNGALVIGDVGQGAYEEIDYEPAATGGRNYGWPIREGAHDYDPSRPAAFTPLVEPAFDYPHSVGFCIIGGYVYRGSALPSQFRGRYFFADLNRRVWSIQLGPDSMGHISGSSLIEHTSELGGSGIVGVVTSWGMDAAGELYLLSQDTGNVLRIRGFSAPAGLTTMRASDRVNLTWTSSPGASSYNIKRGTCSGCETLLATGIGATAFSDTTAVPGVRYFYVVSAVDALGESGNSNEAGTAFVRTGDFDGDSASDLTVFRPSTSVWYTLRSSSHYATYSTTTWGLGTDTLVPADYDGDGIIDAAVFRSSTNTWYMLRSSSGNATYTSVTFGASGDVPVPGDYDGDGRADVAVFRPSTTTWYILKSSDGGLITRTFGLATDKPVIADYDGDGTADIAVFRPSNTTWYILTSGSNFTGAMVRQFGLSTDVLVPGDYDGDGKTDVAVFRPSTNTWYARLSSNDSVLIRTFGASGDTPVPADYDGDGRTDVAVFRPSTATWYIWKSSNDGVVVQTWGLGSDAPMNARP